jgi:hypothetical protein
MSTSMPGPDYNSFPETETKFDKKDINVYASPDYNSCPEVESSLDN